LDDGLSIEVVRVATDGTANACSMLYGACWRAARALGYRRAVTYTQDGESGASLRAAGWVCVATLEPRAGWSTPSRVRADHGLDGVPRRRWEIAANPSSRARCDVSPRAVPDASVPGPRDASVPGPRDASQPAAGDRWAAA
jgi:hypothetical protein